MAPSPSVTSLSDGYYVEGKSLGGATSLVSSRKVCKHRFAASSKSPASHQSVGASHISVAPPQSALG